MKEFVVKYFDEFKVKKGDIISYRHDTPKYNGNYITLIVKDFNENRILAYAGLNYNRQLNIDIWYGIANIKEIRFAHLDEVNELFCKLNSNYLKWNKDTKELESIRKYLEVPELKFSMAVYNTSSFLINNSNIIFENELKIGDMAICWNKNKSKAVIAEITNIVPEDTHPYYACLTKYYKNAIKWDNSIETYKNFIDVRNKISN